MIQLIDVFTQTTQVAPGDKFHVGLQRIGSTWQWKLAPPDKESEINPYPATAEAWVEGPAGVEGSCAAIRAGGEDIGPTGLVPVACDEELRPLCMHFAGRGSGGGKRCEIVGEGAKRVAGQGEACGRSGRSLGWGMRKRGYGGGLGCVGV